jgi:glutamine amidotransferase
MGRTAIIDYDAGNIRSVENAMKALGQESVLTRDPKVILSADHVILPGVGAFGDAMDRLNSYGLVDVFRRVTDEGIPFLGICLGLQLLFEESEESPGVKGLSILPGRIVRIPETSKDPLTGKVETRKVPEIGWNDLTFPRQGRLFKGIPEHSYVYFVHSCYLQASDPSIVTARTAYGTWIDASVEKGNVFACQFHPEKSERIGMKILTNFLCVRKEDASC